jgi:hypothetical protein
MPECDVILHAMRYFERILENHRHHLHGLGDVGLFLPPE